MGKQSSRRNAERMVTALATPLLAGLDEVVLVDQSASQASRITIAPTGFFEQLKSGLVG